MKTGKKEDTHQLASTEDVPGGNHLVNLQPKRKPLKMVMTTNSVNRF